MQAGFEGCYHNGANTGCVNLALTRTFGVRSCGLPPGNILTTIFEAPSLRGRAVILPKEARQLATVKPPSRILAWLAGC